MALNISPNFVRFTRSDDEALSAGDESAHEQRLRGEPGSRRYRRFLNTQLSDYESEFSATDLDEENDGPIVDFEWNSDFTRVGTEFYAHTDRSAQVLAEKLRKSHERKVRGRRKVMDKLLAQFSDEEDEADLYDDEQRRESRRLRRKMRRPHKDSVDSKDDGTVTEGTETEEEEKTGRREYIDQESGWANWQRVDARARPLLRRMNAAPFLKQLEAILIPYKLGQLTSTMVEQERRKAAANQGFDISRRLNHEDEPNFVVISFPDTSYRPSSSSSSSKSESKRSRKSEKKRSKNAEDEEDDESSEQEEKRSKRKSKKEKSGKSKSKSSKREAEAAAADVLVLSFRDAYLRFLAHGIAQFHHLICQSDFDEEGNRVTWIKRPKDFFAQQESGVYTHVHHLSLSAHVNQMARLREHRKAKGPMVGRYRGMKLGRDEEEHTEEDEVQEIETSLRHLRVQQGFASARSPLPRAPGGPQA